MAQLLADRREIDFVLHEQFKLETLSQYEVYNDFNKKVIDMIVTELRNLAINEILPTNKTGDHEGCRYENGSVFVPNGFKTAWNHLKQGEWFAPCQSVEWGGQGIPNTLNVVAQNFLFGANFSLLMVAGLNHAAGEIIEKFGTNLQKELYLRQIYSGEWSGTMLLTEADSGSNLGDLTTTAVENDDGTYSLTGSKIFISGGDQDMTENIIHLILARIEGAPQGSSGLSLFIAPKIHVDRNGRLLEANDIVCTGIEEKMGLHGSPTCSMALGTRGNCQATLVGKKNKGLSIMFLMMNKARLMTGAQGLACASASYLYALEFARSRVQGILPTGTGKKQVSIIQHPDIRRMLLTMKVYTEGMRSLLCYIGNLEDKKNISDSKSERTRYQHLIDILIPVAKGYITDRAVEVCNTGIQIFGGYGYTKEFPAEQLLRDVRITTIYEGTNGIQAIDLLSRKICGKNNKMLPDFIKTVNETIDNTPETEPLDQIAAQFKKALDMFTQTVKKINPATPGQEVLKSYAFASPLSEVFGDIVFGWMLLWRANIAQEKLGGKIKEKDMIFYSGQLKSAQFFFSSILPVTLGKMTSIINFDGAAIEISDSSFGGK